MSNLVWTTERPTVPGWYWLEVGSVQPCPGRIKEDGQLWIGNCCYGLDMVSRFAGPIPLPKETAMSLDLEALERLARAATPGPWVARLDGWTIRAYPERARVAADGIKIASTCAISILGSGELPDVEQQVNNQAYIAECDPQTILFLIARARAAERMEKALEFAGYMVTAAEAHMAAIDNVDIACEKAEQDEDSEDEQDSRVAADAAFEQCCEARNRLASDIYEFRKRAALAKEKA